MKNSIKIGIFSLLTSTLLLADVSGIGYGNSLKEAKSEALSDVSQVIKSEVRTRYTSHSTDSAAKSEFFSQVSSNLPLLGISFETKAVGQTTEAIATLKSDRVLPIYEEKLKTLNATMQDTLKEIKKSHSPSFKLKGYEKLYTLTKEFTRYKSVAMVLDPKARYKSVISTAKVEREIMKLTTDIDSLDLAATVIAKVFDKKDIYLYPPHSVNNSNIAEFGSVMMKHLEGKLSLAHSLYRARYIAVGEYSIGKKSLILNMQLLDAQTKDVVAAKSVVINKKAYKGIALEPQGVDFNTLLKKGVAESSKLKVSLNSNKGSESLLFRAGEEVELFVKLNKMGYLYIVGYTENSEQKISYLLELSEGEGSSRFVKFINADDASKWISLGAFTIEPPFGIESLQVIASNKKITKLPVVKYDEESGYYIISTEIKEALEHTRGLRPKRSGKVESSEDVISFTTMK